MIIVTKVSASIWGKLVYDERLGLFNSCEHCLITSMYSKETNLSHKVRVSQAKYWLSQFYILVCVGFFIGCWSFSSYNIELRHLIWLSYNQRFGSGSGSGSGSGGSGTFWVEAEAEAIFENHLEAEAEAEALVKKKLEAEAEAILKKFGWKRKRKRFFSPSGSGSGSF